MERIKKQLPKKSEDLSEWYNRVVMLSGLADYGPARGTMIFRPEGYGIWENIQEFMDREIKSSGVENGYFPLLIPESFLKKEKDHIEGFAPELAVVTIGGGEELAEKLVIRPTSETIMYDAYSKWIQSWRDLPLEINQWNNVVRWEKRTYLFLRTLEFLWQEGHCAHATHEESLKRVDWAIDMYAKTYRELCALPGVIGRKSEADKFAGGVATWTFEMLMPEGKALQACTSHDLGQNFSIPFGVKFQDKDGQEKNVWQNSWGYSSRSIGALLMAHGDDAGLVLPPRVATIQVIILVVKEDETLYKYARDLSNQLIESGVRARVDERGEETLGFKINKWELKGVPLRIEIGPREMESRELTLVRRDNGEKLKVKSERLADVRGILDQIQANLLSKQEKFLADSTHEVSKWEEFVQIMTGGKGFIKAFWCERAECEEQIKIQTKASTRCLPRDAVEENGVCIKCGKEAKRRWLFAQAY